jgi:hypothetical protein
MAAVSDSGPWAVYQMTIKGKPNTVRVICPQRDWDKMELAQPGTFPLVRGWITSESEAERIAREAPPAEANSVRDKSLPPRLER